MRDPASQERLRKLGYEVFLDESPQDFGKFIKADIQKWVPLVKQSGAQVD
ncbi:hypothetical protein M2C83_39955 [Cupriavidus basilensis]|nr:hypothetical protein [Cupriavidus basilensis]